MSHSRRDVLKRAVTAGVAALGGVTVSGTATAHGDIPSNYLQEYQSTGAAWGLDWTYLAAIGWVESHHGQLEPGCEESYAGALGPMQFMPSTWDAYGIDGDGDGDADICNYRDAIPSAANYLTASGAPEDWYDALLAYNPSTDYVNTVMDWQAHYTDHYGGGNDGGGGADYSWPYFSRGDQSTDIYTVQFLLEQHGYSLQYHDGIYGPETEGAVEQFQADNGLLVDGIVGPQTWSNLYVYVWDANNDPWWATYAVQHNLRYDHGYAISVDGYYGPETNGAITSFQSAASITVDGIVGPETWQALVDL